MNSSSTGKDTNRLPQFILASQSPRRRQILESLGLSFSIVEPKVAEEKLSPQAVETGVQENAYQKALAAASTQRATDIVVAVDTLVVIGDCVVGKPESADEARAMLKNFSGKKQMVVSGLVLFSHYYGVRRALEKTDIFFHNLTNEQIEDYIKTKEPYDKAGGYAVQGLGSLFIDKIVGSHTNAIGFPVELFLRELQSLTQIPLFRWFQ